MTATLESLARTAVDWTLSHARTQALPARRSARRERNWMADLVVACVGEEGLLVVDRLVCGACYRSATRQILISVDVLENTDADFTIAHELGHWYWREVLPVRHRRDLDNREEHFANLFASGLLGRLERAPPLQRPASAQIENAR